MAEFKIAGRAVGNQVELLVGKSIDVDFFGDKGKDINEEVPLFIGICELAEQKSPMPTVFRRFRVKGTVVGPVIVTWNEKLKFTINVKFSQEQEFIERVAKAAAPIAKEFQMPLSVIIAVACTEHAFGKSKHPNWFGITKKEGQNWFPACKVTASGTTEAKAGKGNVTDSFCVADSDENNVRIFCEFVKKHPSGGSSLTYKSSGWTRDELKKYPQVLNQAMNFAMGSPKGSYETTVMGVVDQFNLTRFDSQ